MTTEDWPALIFPIRQTYYIQTNSGLFGGLNGQLLAFARDGAVWTATLDFRLNEQKAAILDALLAKLRGPTGKVLVPDFRRVKVRTATESMDDYAALIGPIFFDDRYDFSDMTQEEGFFTTEEPVPLGLEENLPLEAPFDVAFLIYPDDIQLLTEEGDDLLAENITLPLIAENEDALTLDYGAPIGIGMEEGFIFRTQKSVLIARQVGGGFFEGTGQPRLVGGAYNQVSVDGLAPFLTEILLAGESIGPSPGRAHLVLFDTGTNIDGRGAVFIAPHIREAVIPQALTTGGTKVVMRLLDDDAAKNETERPFLSTYQLRLEEVLP
jgi:hypothetical protein